MKTLFKALCICMVSFLILLCTGFDYPPMLFGEQIDDAWKDGREKEIPGMIKARLAERPGNPLALLIGYYYHLFCTQDIDTTLEYRSQLETKLKEFEEDYEEIGSPSQSSEFAQAVFLGSIDEARAMATNDGIRNIGKWKNDSEKSFPFRSIAEVNAKVIGFDDPVYVQEMAESHEAWKQHKLAILNEIGLEKLQEDTLQFIEVSGDSPSFKMYEHSWPKSFGRLDPVVIYCHPTSIHFGFWKIGGVYDGVGVYFDETDPRRPESPGYFSEYTKLADHIYWHTSRN